MGYQIKEDTQLIINKNCFFISTQCGFARIFNCVKTWPPHLSLTILARNFALTFFSIYSTKCFKSLPPEPHKIKNNSN